MMIRYPNAQDKYGIFIYQSIKHAGFFLFFFSRKQALTFQANCLKGDNLHEMLKHVFWGKK